MLEHSYYLISRLNFDIERTWDTQIKVVDSTPQIQEFNTASNFEALHLWMTKLLAFRLQAESFVLFPTGFLAFL
jgi:hypothetical protein